MKKHDCYECEYRRQLDHTPHSECHIGGNICGSILILGEGKPPRLDPHGVKHGWAHWPFNFDPIWVEECLFFHRKGDTHEDEKCDPVSKTAENRQNANAVRGCIAETTTTS